MLIAWNPKIRRNICIFVYLLVSVSESWMETAVQGQEQTMKPFYLQTLAVEYKP